MFVKNSNANNLHYYLIAILPVIRAVRHTTSQHVKTLLFLNILDHSSKLLQWLIFCFRSFLWVITSWQYSVIGRQFTCCVLLWRPRQAAQKWYLAWYDYGKRYRQYYSQSFFFAYTARHRNRINWVVLNCVEVFILHRDRLQQIPIGFPSVSVSVSFCLGVGQCKCTVRVKFVSVSIALFTVNIWHMSDSEMDGCGIWKMEESFAGAINSSSPCGVLLSPRFPGFVEPGYWAWLIEGIDGFYFDIYIYYVRGPQLTGGDCGQFFQGKPIEFYCVW